MPGRDRPGLDHFGLLAPVYERVISRVSLEQLLGLLELAPESRLLDVGGGTGRVSGLMAGRVAQTVLTDVSWGMVRQAKTKDGLVMINAEAERLPFGPGSFDRILMVDAFHHLDDQRQASAELMRVLAPAGRMVIEEPNIEFLSIKLVALAERLALMRSRFFRPAAMKEMFEVHGGRVAIHVDPEDRVNVWLVVEKE